MKEALNIRIFNEIYEKNKKLDEVFIKKYDHAELIKKNKLELLVEIGELANETRCFKYWSKKEVNHDLVGFELADCFIMTLCFFNTLNIDLEEKFYNDLDGDVIDMFFNIYSLTIEFIKNNNRDVLKKLFVSLINLGHNLGFKDDEIISYCTRKIDKDLERLNDEKTS